jgi:vacuolar-type H+-ATPase subunit I/STV1
MIIWTVTRELRTYNVLRFKCYSIKNYCLAKVSFLQDKNKTTQSRYNIRVQNQFCYKRQNNNNKKTRTKKKEKKQKKTLQQRVQTNKQTSVNMDSRE